MRTIKLLTAFAVIALAISCTATMEEAPFASERIEQELTITASVEADVATRTELSQTDGSVLWTPGDAISLFYGSGSNGGSRFESTATESTDVTNFTGTIGVITGGADIAPEDTYFWGLYPYSPNASCDGSSVTMSLPAQQTAVAGTFAPGTSPSLGRSQGLSMGFFNICGGVKFSVTHQGINKVTLRSIGGELIAGTAEVSINGSGLPVVQEILTGTDAITLVAPSGEYFEVGQYYYIMMFPTQFTSGFTLTLETSTEIATVEKNSIINISRSYFGRMSNVDNGATYSPKTTQTTRFLAIPGSFTVPYICNEFETFTERNTISDLVQDELGIDNSQFAQTYEFAGVYVVRGVLENGTVVRKLAPIDRTNNPNPQPGDVFTVKFTDYINPSYAITKNWGEAMYYEDVSGTNTENALWWAVNPYVRNGGIGESTSASLYYHFISSDGNDSIYFVMTVNVARSANFLFGSNKIASEWFSDIFNESYNTVRLNAPVPDPNVTTPVIGGDVSVIQRDLTHLFTGNKPALVLSSQADPVYTNYFTPGMSSVYPSSELATTTHFYFANDQPVINRTQLYTNWWSGSDILYVVHKTNNQVDYTDISSLFYMDEGSIIVPALYNDSIIATIENDVIRYNNSIKAKQLINLYSYDSIDQTQMFYCNIVAKNYYGPCLLPAADGMFHVRLLRPISMNILPVLVASGDSNIGGASAEIAKFFSAIIDWRNQDVIVPEYQNGIPTGFAVENVVQTVNLYKYYQFSEMRIDLNNATRNNYDVSDPSKFGKVKTVTPSAELSIGTFSNSGVFTKIQTGGKYYANIVDLANLKPLVINYKNEGQSSEYFMLHVPIEIDYAWGTLALNLQIRIGASSN